jgi:hypothetical protein
MKKQAFATGGNDFKPIIEHHECYVDKTLLIRDILELGSQKVVLFTRPRRFGKSLNCDMVKTFLELEVDKNGVELDEDKKENRDLFKNLKIGKDKKSIRARAELGKYPVISLSFNGIKTNDWDGTYRLLRGLIAEIYTQFAFLLDSDKIDGDEKSVFRALKAKKAQPEDEWKSLLKLSNYLGKYYGKKVVILIDEYDAILTYAYQYKYYVNALGFIQKFLTFALKDNKYLRLGYLTGIFPAAQASIFSLLNNLDTYTVNDKPFSQYFGFTKNEVKELATRYGALDKIGEIRKWYSGYKYGNSEIYNPWSILKYFSRDFEPEPYWIDTADNSLVYSMMLDALGIDQENIVSFMDHGQITTEIQKSINFNQLENSSTAIWTFLLSAGYLTIVGGPDGNKRYKLAPPNLEIKDCVTSMFTSKLNDTFCGSNNVELLINSIINGKTKYFQNIIIGGMKAIPSNYDSVEQLYLGLIIGIMLIKKEIFKLEPQPDSGSGRPGFILYPRTRSDGIGIIFDFKKVKNIVKNEKEANKQIFEHFKLAFDQINGKDYKTDLKEDPNITKILKYIIVFSHKKCSILLQVNNENTLNLGDGNTITVSELDKYKKLAATLKLAETQ